MGPLQGKLETVNTVAVVAAATGASIAETGTTTWRPPYDLPISSVDSVLISLSSPASPYAPSDLRHSYLH